MDELIWALIVGLFKLIFWLIRGALRLLVRLMKSLGDGKEAKRTQPPPIRLVDPKAQSIPIPARSTKGPLAQLSEELAEIISEAEALSTRCRSEPPNVRLVDTLRDLVTRAKAQRERLLNPGAQVRLVEAQALGAQIDRLLEVVSTMAAQRRVAELADLLGDSDALADSLYAPIVDHCQKSGIPLTSDHAITLFGGDKLFLLSVDDPTGLAAIVLPEAWATDLGWWPALAHEIGHDFYRSVAGLGRELVTKLGLPLQIELPGETSRLSSADLDRAVSAWHEELFADAFGTMMLGPAYVLTMSAIFAQHDQPVRACAVGRSGGRYEEHPPGHVRVACAARLLGQMGYGQESDRLETAWRKQHADPDRIYFPTASGSWRELSDESVIERALDIGSALYETGLDSLAGSPLRSITGLDFGPAEHARALEVKESLRANRRPRIRDPRLLIAGAVLGWYEHPLNAAAIYRVTRDAIVGIAAPRPRISPIAVPDSEAVDTPYPELLRDAILLDTLLAPPRGSRLRR